MNYFFSATTLGFYQSARINVYAKAGTLPSDLISVTDEAANAYRGVVPPVGKTLGSDEKGLPCWVDKPEKTSQERIAELKRKLSSTDFKFLGDYDKADVELESLADDRQAWREEIRSLEKENE